MAIKDDDDRAYNASVDDPDLVGWYPEWEGPDTGAMEEWANHIAAMDGDDSVDFLPEFNSEDLPFEVS